MEDLLERFPELKLKEDFWTPPVTKESVVPLIPLAPPNPLKEALDSGELVKGESIGRGVFLAHYQGERYALKECPQDAGEALVGLLLANTFRQDIPNFVLTHGYCFLKNVVVTEYIEGIDLEELYAITNEKQFNKVIMSAVYALHFAHQRGFTHYDPMPTNIIVKDNEEEMEIDYDGKIVKTQYIPVFIDYGLSSFRYNDRTYGVRSTETFVLPMCNPMADFQRFLMALDACMAEINPKYKHLDALESLFIRMSGDVSPNVISRAYGILPCECYVMTPEEVIQEMEKIFS